MILFFSNSGESLPVVHRIRQEGVDAQIYVHHPDYQGNYDGIVEKVLLKSVKTAVKKADAVIFDITRINEGEKHDQALLKIFGLPNQKSVFGPVADVIKKERPVIGCSTWSENIEFDREFGSMIAKKIGLKIPETKNFRTIEQAKTFLSKSEKMWVLKPHDNSDLDLTYVEKYPGELLQKMDADLKGRLKGKFMLQEKINGVEVSTEGWFDGEWRAFNHTIESKRMMNSDLGPSIGSQSNTVWMEPDPILINQFEKLTPIVKQAGYIGPVDINCIVKDDEAYFLEFTPRMGYDALYNLLTLLDGDVSDFLMTFDGDFKDGFSSSQRITIPPFPYDGELLERYAKDIPLSFDINEFWALDVYENEGLKCAGADGIIGVMANHGDSIGGSCGNVYRSIREMKIGSYMQYRTDGAKAQKRYDGLYKD